MGAETQTVAEAFREKLSDDLHDYYTFTTKTPNYAGRLIRIMSIVHTIEVSIFDTRQHAFVFKPCRQSYSC